MDQKIINDFHCKICKALKKHLLMSIMPQSSTKVQCQMWNWAQFTHASSRHCALLTWANQLWLMSTLFRVSKPHSQNLLVGWFFRNVVVWTSLSTCPKSSGIECELLLKLMTRWYSAQSVATFCQTTQTFYQLYKPSASLNFLPT